MSEFFSSRSDLVTRISSDHGTVHIFKLDAAGAAADGAGTPATDAAAAAAPDANPRSSFSFLQRVLPTSLTPTSVQSYIGSQWSFAQFRLPGSDKAATRSIAAFGGQEKSTFLVVCADGTFFKCRFDPVRGGDCTREDWQRFLLSEGDE